jgi:hypothetical protein
VGQATLLSVLVLADVALFVGLALAPSPRGVSRRYTRYIALNLLMLVVLFAAYVRVASEARAAAPASPSLHSESTMSTAHGF